MYYDLENKIIAAIKPLPAFLPVLRMLNGVVEYDEAKGLLVTERWQDRNRRATTSLSPVLIHFLPSSGKLYLKLQQFLGAVHAATNEPLTLITPRHPGPKVPKRSIPREKWPTVLRRVVENQEPLRKIAGDYGVSYETVRRVIYKARRQNRE
jgi:hypothetical protein